MISIAMATYNGERFLEAQLQSLAAQRLLPGELVVCDDASTDGTLAILRRFARSAPFRVRVETSDVNRGSTASFALAIEMCTGEIISLCDQDDVWLPTKLERIHQAFTREPDAAFVFSDALLVDEQLCPTRERLWHSVGFTARERRLFGFASLLRRNFVTGATLAFRREEHLLPIPQGWLHDAWIALLLTSRASGSLMEEPLIRYRQHAGQQIGAARRNWQQLYAAASKLNAETLRSQIVRFEELRTRLEKIADVKPEAIQALSGKLNHLEARNKIRQQVRWRIPGVLREWEGYVRYSRGITSMFQDLWFR